MEKSGCCAASRPSARSTRVFLSSRRVEALFPLAGIMLGDKMTRSDFNKPRTIDIPPFRQTRLQETKSRPGVQGRWQIPLKLDANARAFPHRIWNRSGRKKRPRIGMAGAGEKFIPRSCLNHATQIENHDPVAEFPNH